MGPDVTKSGEEERTTTTFVPTGLQQYTKELQANIDLKEVNV